MIPALSVDLVLSLVSNTLLLVLQIRLQFLFPQCIPNALAFLQGRFLFKKALIIFIQSKYSSHSSRGSYIFNFFHHSISLGLSEVFCMAVCMYRPYSFKCIFVSCLQMIVITFFIITHFHLSFFNSVLNIREFFETSMLLNSLYIISPFYWYARYRLLAYFGFYTRRFVFHWLELYVVSNLIVTESSSMPYLYFDSAHMLVFMYFCDI